jgi:hypothetical protein
MKKYIPSICEMELSIAKMFGYRGNIIVPNISFGLNIHECDLFIVNAKSYYASEVEIKRSKADLKKDVQKRHGHKSEKIKNLYFAILENMVIVCEVIKPYYENSFPSVHAKLIRSSQDCKEARKLTEKEIVNLIRLGSMRIWNLKQTQIGLRRDRDFAMERYKTLQKNLGLDKDDNKVFSS